MQIWLLAANVLILALLSCITYRLIVTARRRAEDAHFPNSDHQSFKDSGKDSDAARKESSSTFADEVEQNPIETAIAPSALAAPTPSPISSTIAEDLPYADPVDGMPFVAGDSVVSCTCGLAYREESVRWLWDYHRGCCIHCGATVNLE